MIHLVIGGDCLWKGRSLVGGRQRWRGSVTDRILSARSIRDREATEPREIGHIARRSVNL